MDSNACDYNVNATWDDGNECNYYLDGICETCSGETDGTGTIVDNDIDDDAICNDNDNCLDNANTDQSDVDSDEVGDVCDN